MRLRFPGQFNFTGIGHKEFCLELKTGFEVLGGKDCISGQRAI